MCDTSNTGRARSACINVCATRPQHIIFGDSHKHKTRSYMVNLQLKVVGDDPKVPFYHYSCPRGQKGRAPTFYKPTSFKFPEGFISMVRGRCLEVRSGTINHTQQPLEALLINKEWTNLNSVLGKHITQIYDKVKVTWL